MSAEKPEIIRGLVIRKVNRFSDSSVKLINVRTLIYAFKEMILHYTIKNESGTPVIRDINIFNPLIKDIKVICYVFLC